MLLIALHLAIPNPKVREAKKNTWIFEDMWRLVDAKVSVLQDSACVQDLLRRIGHQIVASLKADWWKRTETSGGEIESFLASDPPPLRKLGTG